LWETDLFRLAFDIGGTFTDFVLHDSATGRCHFLKLPSTPGAPQDAVLTGTGRLLGEAGVGAQEVRSLLHATTVATNAVLERKGAPTGLITTEGFKDVLIIGRQKRHEIYDLYISKPKPLVRRRDIAEVSERIDHDGSVIADLDRSSIDAAIDQLLANGREAVAVCLMHAYANDAHEQAIAARLRERVPGLAVSVSSDVSPKFREYERTSTTVANAYVQPIVDSYIAGLREALGAQGFATELFVMQSSGGLVSPEITQRYPIRIIESGPAAGVLMGASVGKAIAQHDLITFDMGGTTAKLGAIDNGRPAIMPTFEIDHTNYKKGSGLPINVPAVELLEIGAGGGSIARVEMGMIAVGPHSAGASPGPICYGQGGTQPTITDANVVLGYISPQWFNGGEMQLDAVAAERGIREQIAEPLGLTVGDAAWGIHLIATGNMENAMRMVSVERGRDPRRYTMIAFGGAGPLHAARLARSIGIPKVVVPFGAGVGSAIGLLAADSRIDVSLTRVMQLDQSPWQGIRDIFADLEARAMTDVGQLGQQTTPRWSRSAYMRYAGQGFEVHVELPVAEIGPDYPAAMRESFDEAYLRKHKFLDPDAAVEVVDWTLAATLPVDSDGDGGILNMASRHSRSEVQPSSLPVQREAYFPESSGYVTTPVLSRQDLSVGDVIEGPAIIVDPDATVLVLPDDQAYLTEAGHLMVEVKAY